jgi:energy-coupling factor transporter ATP-binding protein EcfA2
MERIFITGIHIKNFRLFKDLDATRFGQVNLITGANNSGKTTLLEALFLCLGPTNPSLPINVNARRGLARVSPRQSTIPYLFHKTELLEPIIFGVKTSDRQGYSLRIDFLESLPIEFPAPVNEMREPDYEPMSAEDLQESVAVSLTYTPHDGPSHVSRGIVSMGRFTPQDVKKGVIPDSTFVSVQGVPNLERQARRYSDLDKENKVPLFNGLLRGIEPDLKRTSLAIENDMTMIHADVGFGLVPLTLLGSGVSRLSTILLALANSTNGIALIDEVENSLHHSVMQKAWSAIAQFANTHDCQVFATTLSREFISAALRVFKEEDVDFRLHRLERRAEETSLFTFERDQLEAALTTGWEVR